MSSNVQILDQNIGMVSAYAFAVSKGYIGSEEQFAEDMANVGVNVHEIQEAINTFNNETVPAAIAAVIAKGEEEVTAVTNKGTEQVNAVANTGSAQMSAITSKGEQILTAIEGAGGLQIEAIQLEGAAQKGSVTDEGVLQKSYVTSEGEAQIAAIVAAGTLQIEAVTSTGAAEVAAVEAKGDLVLASIPEDYSTMGYLQELLHDEVADTVQEYTFDGGSVSQIDHKRNNVAIRTDVFTYGDNTITETRTLSGGQSVTIVTNLDTLETAVTYTDE